MTYTLMLGESTIYIPAQATSEEILRLIELHGEGWSAKIVEDRLVCSPPQRGTASTLNVG